MPEQDITACRVCGEHPAQPQDRRCVMCADVNTPGDLRAVEDMDVEGWL